MGAGEMRRLCSLSVVGWSMLVLRFVACWGLLGVVEQLLLQVASWEQYQHQISCSMRTVCQGDKQMRASSRVFWHRSCDRCSDHLCVDPWHRLRRTSVFKTPNSQELMGMSPPGVKQFRSITTITNRCDRSCIYFLWHVWRNGHLSTRGKTPPINDHDCVSKENTRVATAIIAWNFLQLEEKIDIIPDGKSALLNMQVTWGISSLPMAWVWRENTWFATITVACNLKNVSTYFLRKICDIVPDGQSVYFLDQMKMVSFPMVKPLSCHSQWWSRWVVTSLKKFLLKGFQETPMEVCTNCCRQQWWHYSQLDQTMGPAIKSGVIADPDYYFCLVQAQETHNRVWPTCQCVQCGLLLRIRANVVLDKHEVVINYHIS